MHDLVSKRFEVIGRETHDHGSSIETRLCDQLSWLRAIDAAGELAMQNCISLVMDDSRIVKCLQKVSFRARHISKVCVEKFPSVFAPAPVIENLPTRFGCILRRINRGCEPAIKMG